MARVVVTIDVSDDLARAMATEGLTVGVPPVGGTLAEVRCGPLLEFGAFSLVGKLSTQPWVSRP